MKDSTLKYLTHEYRAISEMELRIEELKAKKLEYIKKLEKGFRRNGTLKEAQDRLKTFLERNPKGQEAKRIKDYEPTLRHVIKQLDVKRKHIDNIEKNKDNED